MRTYIYDEKWRLYVGRNYGRPETDTIYIGYTGNNTGIN